ncbi:MAG: type I-U CRISPR-associated helicase/endonuclease Cas3 [Acidimicrobiia bacterium]|nr:type I-U CRISPR-associated helicase/endonuclease Cas3 [Acidimicrobiia bacterium]
MSSSLTSGDFAAFYEEVHGYRPFAWQERLAAEAVDRLLRGERSDAVFPAVVDVPTGAGKTSLIDIAVFLLALDAHRDPQDRRVPRRLAFVIDRRVIVDQAHEHASLLARRLKDAEHGSIAHAVAAALRTYAPDREAAVAPLDVVALRGGTVRDDSWAKRPDTPTVICSTVDQVGSRLLFRGYGISSSMRPIQAGLLGSDTLFVLDEVHLSQPFAETLRALSSRYQHWAEEPVAPRWECVELSATPTNETAARFTLSTEDGDLEPDHNEVLVRRLNASKPTVLQPLKKRPTDAARAAAQFGRECASIVVPMLAERPGATLAVVVNRVAHAVATVDAIEAALHKGKVEADVMLITGRMRPHDRDELMDDLLDRVRTGRERSAEDVPLVVVATQCIEAGADFDFDGLVTECASIDALIQRFGRVDRDGRLHAAGVPSRNVIVATADAVESGAEDPLYGSAVATTWMALQELGSADFGLNALPPGLRSDPSLRPEARHAPHLFPAHLDAWVQTSPKPTPDPPISDWLHGIIAHQLDVTVVWREDLSDRLLAVANDDTDPHGARAMEAIRSLLSIAPPGALESMALPITAVRRWLANREASPVSDVDGASEVETPPDRFREPERLVVRYDGDGTEVIEPKQVRPGDVLVVPCAYGGIGRRSWDPSSTVAVDDLSDEAQRVQRGRVVLRLTPTGLDGGSVERPAQPDNSAGDGLDDVDPTAFTPLPDPAEDEAQDLPSLVQQWLGENVDRFDGARRTAAELLLAAGRTLTIEPVWLPGPGSSDQWREYFLLARSKPLTTSERSRFASEEGRVVDRMPDSDIADSDPDTSSFTSVEVPLDRHLDGVGEWAERLATNCGVPPELVSDLALAGRLHDLGKADPRFQRMLRNGDPRWATDQPLAKSALPAMAYQARRRAQELSGYPSGTRHEVMSLALIESQEDLRSVAHDWDLVCHLVASHHGRCRPFAPPVLDPSPLEVDISVMGSDLRASTDHGLDRLDRGVPDRFWRLVRRYGWFRLAWFEAILRLADHRQSEAEQRTARSGDEQAGDNERRSVQEVSHVS